MANTRTCRPKRYAALLAQTLFSQEQTSALYYKEQNDIKKAVRKSLIEARRVANRANRSDDSNTKYVNGDYKVDKSQSEDSESQEQPDDDQNSTKDSQSQTLSSSEETSPLFYREHDDMQKALRKSLLEARRAVNRTNRTAGSTKYVNGAYKIDKSHSEDSESLDHEDADMPMNSEPKAKTVFSSGQASALFYKEENDLKEALRQSLIEARRVASRADRAESDSNSVNGDTVVKDSPDEARPKRFAAQRAQTLFSQDQTSALYYKEQNDLKKAMRKSLIEARRVASRAIRSDDDSKYVVDYKVDESRSVNSSCHKLTNGVKHSNKDSQYNNTANHKSKKLKVHAQRKFASSSVNNISTSSPVKSDSKNYNTMNELFPRQRPSTEDFLTFLCFRSTKLLPLINGSYKCND